MTAPATIVAPDGLEPGDLSPRAAGRIARADRLPAHGGSYPERLLAAVGALECGAAPVSAVGDGVTAEGAILRFDPVSMRADLAGLVVLDGRAFSLSEQDSRALLDATAAVVGPAGLDLVFGAPLRWYATAGVLPEATLTPLPDAAGMRAHKVMPDGRDGARLRALMNEVQMALHAHPVNAAREARGELPVNSIWPWGGGIAPAAPLPADGVSEVVGADDDALARGLAGCLRVPFHNIEDASGTMPEGRVVALERASPESVSMWMENSRRVGFDLSLQSGRWRYRPRHALKFWRRKAAPG